MSAYKLSCLLSASAMAGAMIFAGSAAKAEEMPSREEMWKIIQQQQKQIDSLLKSQQKAEQKIEATAAVAEKAASKSTSGGEAGGTGWWQKTQIGGYGEMHYNAMRDNNDDQVDFHRFVLFLGHDFNDKLRLHSEVELEHSISGEGQNGEVELEQAYIEYDITPTQHAKAGIFLMPVGIINETHEPPSFYGVERNPVENKIIPATWWEGGAALNGQIASGFSYDFALHSGLSVPTSGGSAFKVRDGRQKVSQADADKGAVTGRLKWTGMPGVELASSLQYQQDVTQNNFSEDVDATLWEAHAAINRGGLGLRALYARWDLDGTAPAAVGRDEQYGWYVEPSYKFNTQLGDVGFFTRYNEYDNEAGDSTNSKFKQYDVGMNFWPHEHVVLKMDVQFNRNPGATPDDEILNLGVGFHF